MADTLRELAAAHPELLTRECKCGLAWAKSCGCIPGSCSWCDDTGRRLATLEELLEALPAGWTLLDDTRPGEVLVEPYCCYTDDERARRGKTPWEAAARLLIEVCRD